MKKFFNWVIVVTACVGAFYLIGLIVPRSQTQSSKTTLQADPNKLFAVIADPTTWSDWNPDISSIQEQPDRDHHKIWSVTDKHARAFELEVMMEESGRSWQGTYTIDGARYVLRFDFLWFGQGSRVMMTKTVDTRDTWKRAKRFLLPTGEAAPIAMLNGVAEHMGESVAAVEN